MVNKLESGLKGEIFVDKNTAFVVEKYNPKDLVEKEIGDSKVPDKFIPQQKVMRWDNEVNFSVRLVHDEKTPDVVIEGDSVVWRGKKVEAKFYDVFNDKHPEGAGEFEIVLKEKPATNIVEFSLNTKGLDFFYQPALTPEEIAEGSFSPENVVGSYAVYASEQKTNYVGGKEYKTGKVGHIYRPQVEDAKGTKVWGDLNIDTDTGILAVTIPQEFLDKAVYPVRHAAGLTFGYTTAGSSYGNGAGKTTYCKATASSAGNLSKLSAYLVWNQAGSGTFKHAVYSDSSGASSKLATATNIVISNAGAAWYDGSITLANTATTYHLASFNTGSAAYRCYYDTGSAGDSDSDSTYTDLPATASLSGLLTNRLWSLYATYTASGGGSSYTSIMMMGLGT